MVKQFLIVAVLVLALRLPFLTQPIQGDDPYYLYGAEHAQIDPLHPTHTRYFFMGDLVDMRGHPHPPLNSWILAILLAAFGDVREVPFHLFYILFSLIAAAAMLSLACRFTSKPLLATLLFCAVPAFVVNGNSFEADLPFLAFWMTSAALFVTGADRKSKAALAGSAAAAGLAGLAAYQAIFLTPILAVYLWNRRSKSPLAWATIFAAPVVLASWQLWERIANGALPATMLAGYLSSYDLESVKRKTRAITAIIVNLGWIVSPLIVVAAMRQSARWQWGLTIAAVIGAVIYDPNPLFWLSIGCGVWILSWCATRGFLEWWILIFFACAVVVFFVGSARYLLPIAAPLCMLLVEAVPRTVAITAIGLQLLLSLALATVNYQHWNGYREIASQIASQAAPRRIWTNAEWGFRWYLEDHGGLPLAKDQTIRPGDFIVTSELAGLARPGTPLVPFSQAEISSRIPLRLISLQGRSAYSVGKNGSLPFEISTGPIDLVRAEIAIEPKLTYVEPGAPAAPSQIISGISADGWIGAEARVLLKSPAYPSPLEITVYVPENAPGRHIRVLIGNETIIDKDLPGAGLFTFSNHVAPRASSVVATLTVDKTFSVPGDARALGLVVKGIGFR